MKILATYIAVVTVACLAVVPLAPAGDEAPFTALEGLDLAVDAARAWADDAQLIYLENDEPVAPDGTATRWGYLFYSPAADESRGYSLRRDKVLEAADLEFDFQAPPLPEQWLDSRAVLAVAHEKAGREYIEQHGGRLSTMLLIRGAFHEKNPDRSTWTVVYTSDTEPNLLVVVDAEEGKVVRQWKG
jgi:hypothetical protein